LSQLILHMLVLALDTTTRTGSIALARDGAPVDSLIGDPSRTHAERLPADIRTLLVRNGTTLGEVDVFAVASGPGSFTGLRIGIATIQGLAFANRRPVAAVSALDALAAIALTLPVGREPMFVAAWIDAHRGEVFSRLHRAKANLGAGATSGVGALDGLESVDEAAVADPGATLDRWTQLVAGHAVRFIGDGAVRYRSRIEDRLGGLCEVVEGVPPLAPAIAVIGARLAERGLALAPHAVRPVYVRRPDAELARERLYSHPRARS
jgi:tRNA threonylcarbamoyladenosine biosynthesis protein TsaB